MKPDDAGAQERLPDGFTARLDEKVRRLDGGAALLGGSPTRLLRLAPKAVALLAGGELVVRDPVTAGLARRLLDAGIAHPVPAATDAVPSSAVTAVIPVKDNQAGVDRLLAVLGDMPVIVVDDGSAVPVRAPGATVLRQPVSRGPAAARNLGLAHAVTEFVAFLDSDVVPRPGWLAAASAHFADPTVVLVAPRIVGMGEPRGWLARYEELRSSLDLGPRPGPVESRSRIAYVPSAAMVVRREMLGQVAFDESMTVAEDVDLCWRLRERGWRLRYEPAAQVAHDHRVTFRKWFGRKAFYGQGAAPLAERHPGRVPPMVLSPWSAGAAALLTTGTRSGAVGAAVVSTAAGVRLTKTLRGLRHPARSSARLIAMGLGAAAWQFAGAVCRHYWPVAVVVACCSRRARRTLVAVAIGEGVADWVTHDGPGRMDPVRYVVAKRLDDIAYGSGLWWGALRARSAAALRPVIE